MTRKSKAHKEKRSKETEVEKFRSLEELNQEFTQRKGGGFRSITDLTKDFRDQSPPEGEAAAAREGSQTWCAKKEPAETPSTLGTGVLKKIFEGRGFGFIAPDQDPHGAGDIFLHFSDIIGGGARNLGIGSWVRYDVEPDVGSGRLRAKNVSVITDDSTAPSTEVWESPVLSAEAVVGPSTTACAYTRDIMLGTFKAMTACSRLKKATGFKLTTVPMPPSSSGRGLDQEDPCLDDERLIARYEARMDKELGADALNMQTFGACAGWSFEEAVAANDKLNTASPDVDELMEITTTGGSFSSQRTGSTDLSEDSTSRSDTSEERISRESRQVAPSGHEARHSSKEKGRTWSWEEASEQAKVLEDHRHTWEVDEKQQKSGLEAAPLVFQ